MSRLSLSFLCTLFLHGFLSPALANCTDKPFFTATRGETWNDDLVVRIQTHCLPTPELTGVVLADFAQHFANALVIADKAKNREEALKLMLDLFVREITNPTQEW